AGSLQGRADCRISRQQQGRQPWFCALRPGHAHRCQGPGDARIHQRIALHIYRIRYLSRALPRILRCRSSRPDGGYRRRRRLNSGRKNAMTIRAVATRSAVSARAAVAAYVAVCAVVLLLMMLLGLTMRLAQAQWINVQPDFFYVIMTMHGAG